MFQNLFLTSHRWWSTLLSCGVILLGSGLSAEESQTSSDQQSEEASEQEGLTEEPADDQFAALVKNLRGLEDDVRRDAAREAWEIQQPNQDLIDALAKTIHDRDRQVSANALTALARFGPKAEGAIESLLKKLKDRDDQQRYRAAYALGCIGGPAIEPLREVITGDSRNSQRSAAIQALGFMQTVAKSAVPDLIATLEHEDETVAFHTTETLLLIGVTTVEPLAEATKNDNALVRSRAIQVLGEIRPVRSGIVERARAMLSDETTEVRVQAINAFSKLSGDTAECVLLLTKHLVDEQFEVCRATAHAIASKPKSRHLAIDSLQEMLQTAAKGDVSAAPSARGDKETLQPDSQRVAVAAYALRRLGPDARPALDTLLDTLELDLESRASVSNAIAAIGSASIERIVPRIVNGSTSIDAVQPIVQIMGLKAKTGLLQTTKDGDEGQKATAANLMGFVRPVDDEIVSKLRSFLKDQSNQLQLAAALGLSRMGPDASRAIDDLKPLLESEDGVLKAAATKALFDLGADPSSFVEVLLGGLKSDDAGVRRQAAEAASKLNELTEFQTALMLETLNDADAAVRRDLTIALGKADPSHDAARKALLGKLNDDHTEVQVAAIAALGRFGEHLKDDVRLLLPLLDSNDESVQTAILNSLKQLGTTAQPANEQLLKLASEGAANLKVSAMTTLSKTMPNKRNLVVLLNERLTDDDWSVRKRSAELLGETGEAAAVAVPTLLARLDVRTDSDFARNALRAIDAAPPEAVPVIIKILQNDPSRRTRYYALHLLRKAGANAKDAIPVLQQMIEKGNLDGRAVRFVESVIDEISKKAEKEDGNAAEIEDKSGKKEDKAGQKENKAGKKQDGNEDKNESR